MERDRRKEALLLLGLVDPASEHQITRAYRQVAKRVHPDAADSGQADPDRFAAVHDAYEFLLTTPPPSANRTHVRQVSVSVPGTLTDPRDGIIAGPARVRPISRPSRRP